MSNAEDLQLPFVSEEERSMDDDGSAGGLLKRPPDVPKRRRLKAVHFSEVARCYIIPHINDFSEELIAATWISDKEQEAIATANAQIGLMIINGKRFRSDADCEVLTERGLEYKIPDQRERRRKLKEGALEAVLDEQDRQWAAGINGPNFIAETYHEYSVRAQNAARFMALQDEEDARKIVATDNNKNDDNKQASSNITKKKNRIRQQRNVNFCGGVSMRSHLHVNDCTDNEIDSAWYTPDQNRKFKKENKKIAKALASGKIKESDAVFQLLRGLEYLIPANGLVKRHARVLAYNAVLDEQDQQDMDGEFNPKRIADAYIGVAMQCRLRARNFAREDEAFAKLYTAEVREEWERARLQLCSTSSTPPSPYAAYNANEMRDDSPTKQQEKTNHDQWIVLSIAGTKTATTSIHEQPMMATRIAR